MRNLLTIIISSVAILSVACYKTSTKSENPVVIVTPTPAMAAAPEQVALALFEAARYTNWSRLPTLCMPDGTSERSARDICEVGNIANDKRTTFREEFKQGGTDGKAVIDGDKAKVIIKYDKKLAKTAELMLKKVENRWYLVSFEQK